MIRDFFIRRNFNDYYTISLFSNSCDIRFVRETQAYKKKQAGGDDDGEEEEGGGGDDDGDGEENDDGDDQML